MIAPLASRYFTFGRWEIALSHHSLRDFPPEGGGTPKVPFQAKICSLTAVEK
jgi:hypothetical protein